MSVWWFLLLVGAGVLAGLLAAIGGLASLVSYPALLLAGLSPAAANVTNTVALVATTAGAAAGSRPELAGQGRQVARLSVVSAVGGAAGAALLLTTPESLFEAVVPWLIAAASLALLFSPGLRRLTTPGGASAPRHASSATLGGGSTQRDSGGAALSGGSPQRDADGATLGGGPAQPHPSNAVPDGDSAAGHDPPVSRPVDAPGPGAGQAGTGMATRIGVFLVAVYAGYFGAAAGVILLALLTVTTHESLARVTAAKTLIAGAANAVAAVVFVLIGPVHWVAAPALALGSLVGGRLGPWAVRRLPAGPLRVAIALAGIGLAVKLGLA